MNSGQWLVAGWLPTYSGGTVLDLAAPISTTVSIPLSSQILQVLDIMEHLSFRESDVRLPPEKVS